MEPLEARDVANRVGAVVFCSGGVCTLEGVEDAEGAVAAEGEDAGGFRGVGHGLREDHGGEAGVCEAVEVAGYAVEVQEGARGEVFDYFEGEFGVFEESVEDAEVGEVELVGRRGGRGVVG